MNQEMINKFTGKIRHAAEQAEKHHFLNALCWLHDAMGLLIQAHNDVLKGKLEGWGCGPRPAVEEVSSIEELAMKCGFENANEMHTMIASVQLKKTWTRKAFEHWKQHDGTKEGLKRVLDCSYIMDDRPEGPPIWAGKDIVGYLIQRGWRVEEDGMHKDAHGQPSSLFIPVAWIMDSYGSAEKDAGQVELRAQRAKRCPVQHHHHTCDCEGAGGGR